MLRRTAFARVVLAGIALAAVVAPAGARAAELATARGTIAIGPAAATPCERLVVEARDALDAHLIALARPAAAQDGTCRYAISVPAQSGVSLSVHTDAVLAPVNAARLDRPLAVARPGRPAVASVALRFTLIAATTFIFAPGENKTVPLSFGDGVRDEATTPV
jgi:hypothetical protein